MKVSASLLALAAASAGATLQPIVMKGSKLFYENGTQFFMKGVAYQQDILAAGATSPNSSYTDPLSDSTLCQRDVPLLKQLGTNTIRTYAIDPTADHSACMKLLDAAGIYVISDLSEPKTSINRDSPIWDTELYDRYTAVVDELAQYTNVIGFFAGNEVSNNKSNTDASAFVKAAVRDTKKYIKDNKSRWLGVGYAANDDPDIRVEIAQYFNCGETEDSIDYWGYNIYSWCGSESDIKKSGYADQVTFFQDYSVPVFFAEYGCNKPNGAAGRTFEETTALYSDAMTGVFSGGIVYMYFQEDNDYGLVKIGSDDKATKLKDFSALQSKVVKADPSGVQSDDYTPSATAASCPELTDTWQANSVLPPSPDAALCKCMVASRECVPASNLKASGYRTIFDFICAENAGLCAGINGNATSGVYGAYSMCSASDKLAFVLDAYYNDQNKATDACNFKGNATTQRAATQASCSSSLASASAANEKAATQTAGSASSTSTDDSFGNPSAPLARLFSLGDFAIGAYMFVAAGVGAGMVLL